MNKVLVSIFLFSIGVLGKDFLFEDIVGKYKITHPVIPAINIVEIKSNGDFYQKETTPLGKLECAGLAHLENNIVSTEVDCKNGKSFTQTIDLNKVKNLDEFSAPVYSSLYKMKLTLNFKKQKE